LLVGCICPPCEGGGPLVAGGATAPAAPQAEAAKEVASGAREVVWDGDKVGGSAKGWADCDKKPGCKGAVVAAEIGVEGSKGFKFHGEGPGWIGMGWNWFGWWPETAGNDFRPYDLLTFSIKVEAMSEELAPTAAAISVGMRCSTGKKDSAGVSLEKYLRKVELGKWADVKIPLKEFYKGKAGKEFDPATVWELNINTWSDGERNFDIIIDNVAAEKK
jgi:hypothetical protein